MSSSNNQENKYFNSDSSFDQTKNDPFYRKLYIRMTRDKSKEDYRKDIGSYLQKPIHSFHLYPWYVWIAGGFFSILSIAVTIIIYNTYSRQGYLPIIFNVIFYYISFILLYSGKIERFLINRKKGFIIFSKINIFLSKYEVRYKFDEIKYIEIVIQGIKRGNDDHRKYFLRLYLNDPSLKPIKFGYTWYFETIKFKYAVCVAMIKGLVVRKVSDYYVKDEGTYLDYVY